ncbi:unannotated protein [freshwater metagenome]|uniref:Unannotated protein n=1 Tax=freshwater metagenome TaxID=449393 RepID=A0A6J7E9Y1_9ZZZZ
MNCGGSDLLSLQVGGNEHPCWRTGSGRMRSDCVREVARGRAGEGREPKFQPSSHGYGHNTVLERVCGIRGFGLDPKLVNPKFPSKTVRLDKRSHTRGQRTLGRALNWQEVCVAPQGVRTSLNPTLELLRVSAI